MPLILVLFFTTIITLLIFWIKTILQIADSTFEEGSLLKIIWILLTIFLPVVGTICWYLIGQKSTIEYGHRYYRDDFA